MCYKKYLLYSTQTCSLVRTGLLSITVFIRIGLEQFLDLLRGAILGTRHFCHMK